MNRVIEAWGLRSTGAIAMAPEKGSKIGINEIFVLFEFARLVEHR
jgi:hypothetical protein